MCFPYEKYFCLVMFGCLSTFNKQLLYPQELILFNIWYLYSTNEFLYSTDNFRYSFSRWLREYSLCSEVDSLYLADNVLYPIDEFLYS